MRARTHLARSLATALALAMVGASFPASAVGIEPAKATPLQREQAQNRFLKGKTFFAQKKYGPALDEFRASMEIVESPNTRLFVARCLREEGKLVEAYVEFGRTEVEANELSAEDPRYKKAGESATSERKAMASRLGFVTVRVAHATADSKMLVGGEELRRAGWDEPVPVMPGTTEIVVDTPGKTAVRKTVTVAAGGTASLDIDALEGSSTETAPPPPPPPPPPAPAPEHDLRPYAYVAGAVGVVGLVTFVVAGAKSNSIYDDLKSSCNGPCPASRADDVASGKRWQTIANVGLVVGVIGAATGVTLFVLGKPKDQTAKSGAVQATLAVSPTGVWLNGQF